MPANVGVSDYRSRQRETVGLLIIVACAALLRFCALQSVPPGYHYDEAFEGLEAWKVLSNAGYHPIFFTGNFGVEPLFICLTSLAFAVAGAAPTVQRGVAAFLGTVTVPGVYLLAKELRLLDGRVPRSFSLLSAASLAVMYFHVHFSRVGIEPVLVPLLFCIGFWGLFRGLRTGRTGPCIVAGVCFGVGPYAYPAGRLLLPLAVGVLIVMLFLDLGWVRCRWRHWALLLLVALAVIAPLAVYFAGNPELLTLRTSQVAVSEVQQDSLSSNVISTLAMFSFSGDLDPRNNLPGRPALDWLSAVPFYIGVAASVCGICGRLVRRKDRGRRALGSSDGEVVGERLGNGRLPIGLVVLLMLATMLAPTALSEYAPHFRRAIGASVPAALLVGMGLSIGTHRLVELVAGVRPRRALLEPLVTVCLAVPLLGGSAAFTARDYFVRWASSPDVYYAYDVGLWEIGQYVNELPEEERVYVSPRPATHRTLAFAWRDGQAVRHFDGRSAFVARPVEGGHGGPATYVIILDEDFRGGQLLTTLYPQAEQVRAFVDRSRRVYAEAWRIEDASRLSRGPRSERVAVWEGIRLLGYDLDRQAYHPGETVYLQLWWSCEGSTPQDWTVFTHVLGEVQPDGSKVLAGHDGQPGQGSVATSTWEPGELILDEHQLMLPEDIARGTYALEVGLYDGATGLRAQADVTPLDLGSAAGRQWERADHVILGSLEIE